TDCIAIYGALENPQAGQATATGEPLAVLLSPLHPLRLAWHSVAQRVLGEALQSRRCPAAGLLDSHASPAILALPLYRGGTAVTWRAFFAVGCNEPHWSLLWNRDFLGDSAEKRALLETLSMLGVVPRGLVGGFTG